MTHWIRLILVAIYAKPVQLVVHVMMLCAWCAAAQIYWVVLQVPHHGQAAANVLVVMDIAYSWSLVFSLAVLLQDLQEWRIPHLRQLRSAALILVLAFVFVMPSAFVWSLGGPLWDVLAITMGSAVGTAGALLWVAGFRALKSPGLPLSAGTVTATYPAQLPRPWRAVRLALGPPYATTSWKRRLLEVALLCAVLAGPPMLVVFFQHSLNPRGFPILLHIAEFASFVIAIGLCWLWPLTRVVVLFVSQNGALAELALMPGLGSRGQQLRRLCLVALSVPAAALLALLALALGLVALEQLPHATYAKVATEFALVPLLTLPVMASRLTKPPAPNPWAGALIVYSQTWTWSWVVWSVQTEGWHRLPDIFRWSISAVMAIGIVFLVSMTAYSLWKLSQRPHPFVEVST